MSYFEDLTDYTFMTGRERSGLVNVGWLDAEHAFPRGGVDGEIVERIWRFCCGTVIQTRGYYHCEVCRTRDEGPLPVTRGDESLRLGTGEIRVFGNRGRAYATPDLIYHYVVEHGYCPPAEFLKAVRECPLPGTSEYLELLKQWGIET